MIKDYPQNQSANNENTAAQMAAFTHLGEELLKENKRNRRFKIVSRLVMLSIALAVFVLPGLMQKKMSTLPTVEHAAVVRMEGLVMPGAEIDAEYINPALRNAFSANNTKGVILQINSPGGSPVQAERIYDEIMLLKSEYPEKKVVAVIDDVGASAAYYIACAADEILSAKASLVGSIGVVVNGFGAVDAMKKLGVERRLITAGTNKALLDPFMPLDESQRAYMQSVVDEVHEQFIAAVKLGRGDRLADDDTLFSGLFWNGSKAVTLGLIDQIGNMDMAMRDLIGVEERYDYSPAPSLIEEITGQLGISLSSAMSRVFATQQLGY
ncbi:MAG: protease-4 [Saprospiraceae bacterium]|jgi:protease-4